MVHCFPSNCISRQSLKPRSLQISISVDYNGDGSISKTSALVVHVGRKIYKGESPEQRQADTQSTWGMFHMRLHLLSTELLTFVVAFFRATRIAIGIMFQNLSPPALR